MVKADDVDPEKYDLNFAKAMSAFRKGDYEQSQSLFREALQAKPGDPDANYYLGHSLLRSGKPDEAATVFRHMLERDPQSGRALLGLGITEYNRGQYEKALDSLQAAEKLMPEDPLVHYYQGLAYHRLQSFEESRRRFSQAMTLSPDLAPSARYYSGVGYYRHGDLERARAEFEAVAQARPGTELARLAEEFLKLTREALPAAEPKRWDLTFSTSFEYDSNVVLLPGGTQPPAGATGISQQQDYRTVLYGGGDYRFIQSDTWVAGASYGFYQSFHHTLSNFDVQDHSPTAYIQRQFGQLRVSAQYLFNYTEVGREPYLVAQTGQTFFTLAERGGGAFTQVQVRYQNKDFQDDRFPGNSARDGKNWLVGLSQYLLFAENTGHVRAGYVFDADRTGAGDPFVSGPFSNPASDWAYKGHRLFAGLGLPPVWALRTDVAFDYYWQLYDNPNSFSSASGDFYRRRDEILSVSASVSRSLTKNLSLAFQYSYIRDQSNVQAFDWNRSIYSISLTGQF
jgi:Flp pilus assembly protein TadD